MTKYLSRTKLAFKLSEIMQALEEDRIVLKTLQTDLANVSTDDQELRQIIDTLKAKLISGGPRDNRAQKWKEILTVLLNDKQSEEAKSFINEFADLLE